MSEPFPTVTVRLSVTDNVTGQQYLKTMAVSGGTTETADIDHIQHIGEHVARLLALDMHAMAGAEAERKPHGWDF